MNPVRTSSFVGLQVAQEVVNSLVCNHNTRHRGVGTGAEVRGVGGVISGEDRGELVIEDICFALRVRNQQTISFQGGYATAFRALALQE